MDTERSETVIPIGENLTDEVHYQNINDKLVQDLKAESEERNGYGSVLLYDDGNISRILYYFDSGAHETDRKVDNGSVILDVLSGKLCLQADEDQVHIHPVEGESIYLKAGVNHSIQADKPSTILMTIVKSPQGTEPDAG